MATAKKKRSTAKRAVKHVAKAAAAMQPSVKAARATESWTQSAKLLPFPDMNEAASVAQSAAENMMRMSQDAMSQWWNVAQSAGATAKPEAMAREMQARAADIFGHAAMPSLPNFNASAAQEQLSAFTRESAEQLGRTASSCNKAMSEAMAISKESAETLVEVSNIAVALTKELGAELINFSNKSFAQNVELSKQVLACRTLNDMFDLSSRFMKTNLDSFFSESVKLSELMFQASTDVSEPLNERFTESSERLSKAIAA